MHTTISPPRIWPTVPAAALAAIIVFAANEAKATQSQQLHESRVIQQIQRYCTTSWRNANIPRAEWSDCSQQVFAELLERVSRENLANAIVNSGSPERRELNRSIWRMIQRWIRAVRYVSLGGSDCPDPTTIRLSQSEGDNLEIVMKVAAERLTPRQNRILSLLCDGQSIREIAKQLGIPARRVSDEKYRAIQKIGRYVGTPS